MKDFNLKRVLIVVGAIVAIGLGIGLYNNLQSQREAEQFLNEYYCQGFTDDPEACLEERSR